MAWLDEEWDTASRWCEWWWVRCQVEMNYSRNVYKIIKGVILEVLMLPNQSWCSISFIPHYTFHLALLCAHLSHSYPFPVTNITSFRTDKQVQKDVPTRVISNSLLGQARMTHPEGRGLSLDIDWFMLWTWLLCCPLSRWSSSGCDLLPLPDKLCSPSYYYNVLSQMKWTLGSLTWRKEWVSRNDRRWCITQWRLENHSGYGDGALLLKDWLSRLEWYKGLFYLEGTFGLGEFLHLNISRIF